MHMHAPWAVRVWVVEIFFTQYCTVLMILDQVVGVLKWQVCAFQVWILYYVCQYAYMVTRWLYTLHNIILAHHHQNCECDSGFCASCGDVESLSPSTCIRLMLCPPFCIHGSSIPLFDWNCIEDKHLFHFVVHVYISHSRSYFLFPVLLLVWRRFVHACNVEVPSPRRELPKEKIKLSKARSCRLKYQRDIILNEIWRFEGVFSL